MDSGGTGGVRRDGSAARPASDKVLAGEAKAGNEGAAAELRRRERQRLVQAALAKHRQRGRR